MLRVSWRLAEREVSGALLGGIGLTSTGRYVVVLAVVGTERATWEGRLLLLMDAWLERVRTSMEGHEGWREDGVWLISKDRLDWVDSKRLPVVPPWKNAEPRVQIGSWKRLEDTRPRW